MEPSQKRKLGFGLGIAGAVALGASLLYFFPLKKDTTPAVSTTATPAAAATPDLGTAARGGIIDSTLPDDIDNLGSGRSPDLVVNTTAFTTLWRDILKAKVAKTIVNEDLLFYYEESESHLSLKGSVKRIAFERDMTVLDDIFAYVLDRPLKLAFWKGYHGRLNHFLGITNRSGLTDVMTKLGEMTLDDKQLAISSTKEINGKKVNVFKLSYGAGDTLYFYADGDDLIFSSSTYIPHPDAEMRKKLFPESDLALKDGEKHALLAGANFLSFGYQFFSPDLEKVRFVFGKDGWESSLFSGKDMEDVGLLAAVPVYPAACSFAPVSMERVEKILDLPEDLKGKFSEEVGVCWYESSDVFTPLFVFKGKENFKPAQFKSVFETVTGSFEKGILTDAEKTEREAQIERMNNGESVSDLIRATKFVKPFASQEKATANSWKLSREVSSPWGTYEASKSKNVEDMRSRRFFVVTLAQHKEFMFFSPDDKLVDNAIAALDKKYPNAGDLMKNGEFPLFLLDPSRLGKMMKESMLDSLPMAEESLFRDSLTTKLFPALAKLDKEKPVIAILNKAKDGMWKEVEWRTYSSR